MLRSYACSRAGQTTDEAPEAAKLDGKFHIRGCSRVILGTSFPNGVVPPIRQHGGAAPWGPILRFIRPRDVFDTATLTLLAEAYEMAIASVHKDRISDRSGTAGAFFF